MFSLKESKEKVVFEHLECKALALPMDIQADGNIRPEREMRMVEGSCPIYWAFFRSINRATTVL